MRLRGAKQWGVAVTRRMQAPLGANSQSSRKVWGRLPLRLVCLLYCASILWLTRHADCPSPQTPYDSGLSGFKHTIQRSIGTLMAFYRVACSLTVLGIDKTLHLYSSVGGRSPVTVTDMGRESWEVEVLQAGMLSLQ